MLGRTQQLNARSHEKKNGKRVIALYESLMLVSMAGNFLFSVAIAFSTFNCTPECVRYTAFFLSLITQLKLSIGVFLLMYIIFLFFRQSFHHSIYYFDEFLKSNLPFCEVLERLSGARSAAAVPVIATILASESNPQM